MNALLFPMIGAIVYAVYLLMSMDTNGKNREQIEHEQFARFFGGLVSGALWGGFGLLILVSVISVFA